MAAIEYENNFMGMNGPRRIKITTPNAKLLEDADTYKLSEEESLLNFQPPVISYLFFNSVDSEIKLPNGMNASSHMLSTSEAE